MRLLWVELRRFFARRVIVGGILGVLLLALVVNAVQLARSRDDLTYVRTQMPQVLVEACSDGTHNGLPIVRSTCRSFGPDVSGDGVVDVYVARGADHRLHVAGTYSETIRGVGIALTLLAALLAATFIAADFGTSIATQLLFEPRRRKVYATKMIAAALACFLVAVLVLVWCGVLQYAGSALRGSTAGIDGSWIAHRVTDIARAASATAMMAAIAFAIGAITRRTAGAIGVLFGLLIAMGFLRAKPWTRAIGRVVPVNAIWAVADGKFERRDSYLGLHTLPGAFAIAVAWVVATMVLGAAWFHRREIR